LLKREAPNTNFIFWFLHFFKNLFTGAEGPFIIHVLLFMKSFYSDRSLTLLLKTISKTVCGRSELKRIYAGFFSVRYCEKNRNQQQILMIQQTTTRTTAQMSNFKTKQKIQQ
jgi:hypothetical protein